jgi:hypothetical protein
MFLLLALLQTTLFAAPVEDAAGCPALEHRLGFRLDYQLWGAAKTAFLRIGPTVKKALSLSEEPVYSVDAQPKVFVVGMELKSGRTVILARARLTTVDGRELEVHFKVRNRRNGELLVYDESWMPAVEPLWGPDYQVTTSLLNLGKAYAAEPVIYISSVKKRDRATVLTFNVRLVSKTVSLESTSDHPESVREPER